MWPQLFPAGPCFTRCGSSHIMPHAWAALRRTMLSASTVGDVIRLHDRLATPQQATLTAPRSQRVGHYPCSFAGGLARSRQRSVGTTPDQNMAVRQLLGSLGWAISQQGVPTHPRIVTIGGVSMTSGSATFIQLQPQREAQHLRQHSFICAAVSASPHGQLRGRAHSAASLSAIMRTLRVTRWDDPCQGDAVAPLCQRDCWGRGPRPSLGTTMPVWLDIHTRLSAGIDFIRGPLTLLLALPSGQGCCGGNQTYPSR